MKKHWLVAGVLTVALTIAAGTLFFTGSASSPANCMDPASIL